MTVVEGLSLAIPTNMDTENAANPVHAAAACGMGILAAGFLAAEMRADNWAMRALARDNPNAIPYRQRTILWNGNLFTDPRATRPRRMRSRPRRDQRRQAREEALPLIGMARIGEVRAGALASQRVGEAADGAGSRSIG